MTQQAEFATLILAAGKGTRMKSDKPKSLHEIAGLPMIGHALKAAQAAHITYIKPVKKPIKVRLEMYPSSDSENWQEDTEPTIEEPATTKYVAPPIVVVISPAQASDTKYDMQTVIKQCAAHAQIAIQDKPLGSADAVRAALPLLNKVRRVLIMFGDTPLIRPQVLTELLSNPAQLTILGFTVDDPTGYGRIVLENENPVQIIEHKDTDAASRKIKLCNGGAMAVDADILLGLIDSLSNDNAQNEYCLPGIIELAAAQNYKIDLIMGSHEDAMGADSRAGLARAEAILQARLRAGFLAEGVSLLAPETVYFSHDTLIGQDVLIEPYCFFGPQTRIGNGVTIKAFSHIEGADIGEHAIIGPYARLRHGTKLAANVKIGNFVETKQAQLDEGVKLNHLSYIGDARIGAQANIGAGTITCNYDGFEKHITEIGAGVFVGSNSTLVAPIKIGAGAYIGAGSTLSKEVPTDALVLTRAPVKQKDGWAAELRTRKQTKT